MVFSITRYTFTTRNHWLLNCIAKKHSLSAPEKRTPGACRTESAVLDWITKPFYVFPLRIQLILGPNSEASEPFTNVRGRRGRWGAHRTPSQAYSTQISQNVVCIVCEQKAVCLLVTLTVSGSFIIKFLMCIKRPLFRSRSCLMFMVPSRHFLSRWRAEIVSYEVSNGMYSS